MTAAGNAVGVSAVVVGTMAALAVAALMAGGSGAGGSRRRLVLLAGTPSTSSRAGAAVPVSARARLAAIGAFGVAAMAWGAIGPVPAAVVGMVTAAVGTPLLRAVLDRGAAEAQRARDATELRQQLPAALDLLAACLVAGCTPVGALAAVARAVDAPLNRHLLAVAHGLADPATGGEALPEPLRPVARVLRRAHIAGAPAADALAHVAGEMRAAVVSDVRVGIARLGVRAVLPLGLCFLPAFVLVGVVPIAVGLLHTMW